MTLGCIPYSSTYSVLRTYSVVIRQQGFFDLHEVPSAVGHVIKIFQRESELCNYEIVTMEYR